MIEIGAQVDLSHPAERVWLALTDRELLGRWFAEAETVEGVPDRMLLHTVGLPGFEANVEVEVAERQEPDLLVLACDEAGRLSELTCAVTATKQGCRLELREVSTHGAWSAEQHGPREQQFRQALTVRLPAILDWLAFQQVDLRRADGGMTAELPLIGVRGRAGRNPRRRRTLRRRGRRRCAGGGDGGMGDVAARLEAGRRARADRDGVADRDGRPDRRRAHGILFDAPLPDHRLGDHPTEPDPVGEALADARVGCAAPAAGARNGPLRDRLHPTVRLHRRDRGRQSRRRAGGRLGGGGHPRRRHHRRRRRRRELATGPDG